MNNAPALRKLELQLAAAKTALQTCNEHSKELDSQVSLLVNILKLQHSLRSIVGDDWKLEILTVKLIHGSLLRLHHIHHPVCES